MPIHFMAQTQVVGGWEKFCKEDEHFYKTRRYAKTLSEELQLVILIALSLGEGFCMKILMWSQRAYKYIFSFLIVHIKPFKILS